MVSALDSESNGPGSRPGGGAALCSWARHFTLTVPLSIQVYKLLKMIRKHLALCICYMYTKTTDNGQVLVAKTTHISCDFKVTITCTCI